MAINDYYTFKEIVFSLRDEYLRNQSLLNEIKKCINVKSDYDYDTTLNFKRKKSMIFNPNDEKLPGLYLTISKRQNRIKDALNSLLDKTKGYSEYRYKRSNADFSLQEINGRNVFVEKDLVPSKYIYHPQVTITDETEFDKLLGELKESKFNALKDLRIYFNTFQSLFITSDRVVLDYSDKAYEDEGSIVIEYNAKDDKMHIKQRKEYNPIVIHSLLNTRIPYYELTDEYIEYLEQNRPNPTYECFVTEESLKREDTLPIIKRKLRNS